MQTSAVDTTPKVYFLDLEVDSVPVDRGEPRRCITQICLYDPSREKGQRVFEAYVNPPKQLRHKEDEVGFGHGKTQKPRYEFKVVWPHLKKWVNEGLDGNRFAVLVGHNMYKHDWKILQDECSRLQEAIPKYWKPFCTLYLAGALGVPKGQQSLASLCQRYNVKHLRAHDAYNDVKMLVNVFGKMTEGADFKKMANAMVLPPREGPVKEVANIVRSTSEAVVVVFDFEATGLFPKKGEDGDNPRATELAAYMPSKDASFCSLIDPGLDEGIKLDKVVVDLTGITEEMIKEAGVEYKAKTGKKMDYKAVWLDFEAWMDHEIGSTVRKVVVLAGHNIWGYDLPLYKAECERFGMKTKWWKSMDTCVLSRHLYKGNTPQYKGFHKLQEIRKRMGIAANNAHRALGDVMVNNEVFERFVAGVDPKKLSSALLSKHPILSTGQLVREEGGTFKPQDYMEVPKDQSSVPVPDPVEFEKDQKASLPAVVKGNPFVRGEEKQAPSPDEFFGFATTQQPPVVSSEKEKPSLKRPRDEMELVSMPKDSAGTKRHRESSVQKKTFVQPKSVPKSTRKKVFSQKDSSSQQPLMTDYIRVKSPTVSRKDLSQETEFTFTFSVPNAKKRPLSGYNSDIDEADLLDAHQKAPKKRRLKKKSEISSQTDQINIEEKRDAPQIQGGGAEKMDVDTEASGKSNFTLVFSDSE